MGDLSRAVGHILKNVRIQLGLSRENVEARSRGRFKSSALGSYERGERTLSLGRFCGLAELYGLLPERVLAEALKKIAPEGRSEIVLDMRQLQSLDSEESRKVMEFAYRVRTERGDYSGELVTLRAGDLEQLAMETRVRPRSILKALGPAVLK